MASLDSSTVSFAGPQISTWPPATSVISACPECTVTTRAVGDIQCRVPTVEYCRFRGVPLSRKCRCLRRCPHTAPWRILRRARHRRKPAVTTTQQSQKHAGARDKTTRRARHELEPGAHRRPPILYRSERRLRHPLRRSQARLRPTLGSQFAMPHLSRWRRMQIPVIAWAAYWVIRLLGPTLRVEVVGVHNAVQIRDRGEPGIGAFWHRCILSAVWIWRNRGIVVLNTVNFDGQWTRRVIERLGFGTAQGSSSRGGVEGLTAMAQQSGSRTPRCVHHRRPARPALCRQAGPRDPGAAHRAGRFPFFTSASKRAHHIQKSWDHVPDSVSVFARGDVCGAADSRPHGRG